MKFYCTRTSVLSVSNVLVCGGPARWQHSRDAGGPSAAPKVCARHGHELMGCESPVGVTSLLHLTRITTSRRQGQGREVLSEGSRSAKVRADGQKSHRRPSARASQHLMTKPTGTVHRVNAAVVHGKFMFLLGEICEGWRREPIVDGARRARWRTKAQAHRGVVTQCERNRQQPRATHAAPCAAMRTVISQKSAKAVLAGATR